MDVSKREKEVLRCLRDGLSTDEIAEALAISCRTVKFHISNILRKLGASNRTQAVALAIKEGIIE